MSTQFIETALSAELLYGDGPPQWPIGRGKHKRPCETAKEAYERAAQLVSWLEKADKRQFPRAANLAKRLKNCRPRHRCCSGACPQCCRAYQRFMVVKIHRLFGKTKAASKTEAA